jgi:solute carrier family 45 protein 1/2/4
LIDGTLNTDDQGEELPGLDSPEPIGTSEHHDEHTSPTPKSRLQGSTTNSSSRTNTPYQSALASTSSLSIDHGPGGGPDDSFQSQDRQPGGEDLTPYVVQKPQMPHPSTSTVVLRHSMADDDDDDDDDIAELSFGLDVSSSPVGVLPLPRRSTSSPAPRRRGSGPNQRQTPNSATATADKAGVILGIHNVFVVLPQFVITLMASIIFHIMEPGTGESIPKHPNAIPLPLPTSGNGNSTLEGVIEGGVRLVVREGMVEGGSSDAVGLIFR